MRFSFDLEIAIADALVICATWLLLRHRLPTVLSWRHEATRLAWIFAIAAAALHVAYAFIRHSPSFDAHEQGFRSLEGMGIMAIAGVFSAVVGKGTPRIAAILRSALLIPYRGVVCQTRNLTFCRLLIFGSMPSGNVVS